MVPTLAYPLPPTTPEYYENTLDQIVAPGLRLWMLLAMIFGILLLMIIVVCCFMKIRIPRTKREIELMAAKRRLRKQRGAIPAQDVTEELLQDRKRGSLRSSKVIVMQSLGVPGTLLKPPSLSDVECTSCAESCGTCDLHGQRSRSCSTSKNSPTKDASPQPEADYEDRITYPQKLNTAV